MKNLLQCTCASKWGEAAPLILRVVTGVIFFMHGYQKLMVMGIPGVTGFLTMLGMPFPGVLAVLLIAGELLGGLFLILGLWTHWSAKVLAFISLVALFTVHLSKGFFLPGYEFILLLLAASVSVMITGPGKWSLDRKMMK